LQASQKGTTDIKEKKRWKIDPKELASSAEKRDQNEN
jgi:hypothetical protein